MGSREVPLRTQRLVLRNFRRTDLDAVAGYLTLPEVQRYLDWKSRDRADCAGLLEAMSRQVALRRPGDVVALAITRSREDQVIGQVSLRWVDATAAQAELTFALAPEVQGRGYAREAIRAMLDLGFGEYGMHRIFARCSGRNHASIRVLERLGFRLEAHFREHALFQGEWDEELHFAMLDREWMNAEKVTELTVHRVA